jgi:hypothetical protein
MTAILSHPLSSAIAEQPASAIARLCRDERERERETNSFRLPAEERVISFANDLLRNRDDATELISYIYIFSFPDLSSAQC